MRVAITVVLALSSLAIACESDDGGAGSSGTSGSSSGSSSGASGSGVGGTAPTACRKHAKSEQCECSSGELSISGDWNKVPNCDSAPSGSLVCAHYATSDEVDSCYYRVPHCATVNRNYTTCECGLRDDSATQVSTCGGSDVTCCSFKDSCQCTSLTSLDRTQFDEDCGYGGSGGKKVSTCTPEDVKPTCEASLKSVTSCAGLKWQKPGSGGGGSSSSGGCDGCHADTDCGHCGRCTLSTCTCSTKAVCN